MAPQPYLVQYRSNLEDELKGRKFEQALERLKATHVIFRKYPAIEDLKTLAQAGNRNYTDKDDVLTILLKELKESNTVYSLINIMFWDSLIRLYWQRKSRIDDHEELFNRIQLDFYHTVRSHNLECLPRKIDVNIFLNTKKKVIAWEKEKVRQDKALRELESLGKVGLSLADLEATIFQPEELALYLLDKVYRKVISEPQYDLLIETQVYKRMSPQEWALKKGIPHATARIFKHRAEKALRRFEDQKNPFRHETKQA